LTTTWPGALAVGGREIEVAIVVEIGGDDRGEVVAVGIVFDAGRESARAGAWR